MNSNSLLSLTSMPSASFDERKTSALPTASAVYFVIDASSQVLYVGRTRDLRRRFRSHHRELDLFQNHAHSILWQLASLKSLRRMEQAYITHYRPTLNHKHRRRMSIIPPSSRLNEQRRREFAVRMSTAQSVVGVFIVVGRLYATVGAAAKLLGLRPARIYQLIKSRELETERPINRTQAIRLSAIRRYHHKATK